MKGVIILMELRYILFPVVKRKFESYYTIILELFALFVLRGIEGQPKENLQSLDEFC